MKTKTYKTSITLPVEIANRFDIQLVRGFSKSKLIGLALAAWLPLSVQPTKPARRK